MSDKPVVVGIDGSPVAFAAMMWAARVADARHLPLLIVLAGDVPDPTELAIGSPNPSAEILAGAEQAIRRVFRDRVKRLAPLFTESREATPDCSGADDAFAVLRAGMFLATHGKNLATRSKTTRGLARHRRGSIAPIRPSSSIATC